MTIRNRALSWLSAVVLVQVALSPTSIQAQQRTEIHIPDIPGYVTLKGEFHIHTVFSDGLVWPTVRVDEAWRDGLDTLSITDHIEYLSFRDDVKPNHERSYEIALPQAQQRDILLIKGAEITRDAPNPGHFNALFLREVTPLDTPDLMDAFNAAREQEAFVFWCHPGWRAEPGASYVEEIHEELSEKGLIQGVEIVNGYYYYEEGHQWALDKNLTLIGVTDAHHPVQARGAPPFDYHLDQDHQRPMTLVFARERSVEGIREALFSGRTAVWYRDQVIGRPAVLEPLLAASVIVHPPHQRNGARVWVKVENRTDLTFAFTRTGSAGPGQLRLPPRSTQLAQVDLGEDGTAVLEYEVTNLLVAPNKGLPIRFTLSE